MTVLATASGCSGNRAWLAVEDRDSHPGSELGPEDTPYSAMISKTGTVPAAR